MEERGRNTTINNEQQSKLTGAQTAHANTKIQKIRIRKLPQEKDCACEPSPRPGGATKMEEQGG